MVNNEKKFITKGNGRRYGDVYDFGIDWPHEYKTASGVISHNTTLAKILANSIDSTIMYLNCSDENSVETVREKIKNFASTMSFTRWKVAILDECLESGTLVTVLRAGSEIKIPIELLNQENDLVKSFNIETGLIEWQPFYLWDKGLQEICKIS